VPFFRIVFVGVSRAAYEVAPDSPSTLPPALAALPSVPSKRMLSPASVPAPSEICSPVKTSRVMVHLINKT